MNDKKSILEMARGGFMERVDYEMPKILENILDPNTKATFKRKLTITMEFIPTDERFNFSTSVVVKPTLAPTNPVHTNLYIAGEDSNGELQVVEMVPQIPGQMGLDGGEQEPPSTLKMINFAKEA